MGEPQNLYDHQPRPPSGVKKGVHEVVELVGGIAWLVGLVTLFILPPLGLLILLVAIILTILSVVWTRQRRHQELVQAASPKAVPTVAPKTPQDRLAALDELKASGSVSDDEYEQQRRRILDEI